MNYTRNKQETSDLAKKKKKTASEKRQPFMNTYSMVVHYLESLH